MMLILPYHRSGEIVSRNWRRGTSEGGESSKETRQQEDETSQQKEKVRANRRREQSQRQPILWTEKSCNLILNMSIRRMRSRLVQDLCRRLQVNIFKDLIEKGAQTNIKVNKKKLKQTLNYNGLNFWGPSYVDPYFKTSSLFEVLVFTVLTNHVEIKWNLTLFLCSKPVLAIRVFVVIHIHKILERYPRE